MRAAFVFAVLVVAPIVFLPGMAAFFVILAVGLPATVWALQPEKPSRLDPHIWSKDAAETERRYAAAIAKWKTQS